MRRLNKINYEHHIVKITIELKQARNCVKAPNAKKRKMK